MAAHLKPTDTRVDALVSGRRFKPTLITLRSDVCQNGQTIIPLREGKSRSDEIRMA